MILPRWSLVTIYKSFTRPYLDYGDINFDQELNKSFHDNLESIQYFVGNNWCKKRYFERKSLSEIRFRISPIQRPWFRKLCTFYKIYNYQSPIYLYNLIPRQTSSRITRSSNNIACAHFKHNFSTNSFFPCVIIEWNNLWQFKKCKHF